MSEQAADDIIVLTDEEGQEHEFTVVDVLAVEGKEYAVLLPSEEQDEEEEEAVILRVETDENGSEVLVDIDDDAEFDKVAAAWQEMLGEELDDEVEGNEEEPRS